MQTIETVLKKEPLGPEEAGAALKRAVARVRENAEAFGDFFPGACSVKGTYEKTENDDWTDGFFTGEIWLAYEETGDDFFRKTALKQVDSFLDRMRNRIVVDHHDMGFLYSPSCVAAYRLTQSSKGREAALMAADNLLGRYQDKGDFFQAWGPKGKREEYRLIIDCLMNLPLLFWASRETGEEIYAAKARKHIETALKVLVRDDYSTFHTFFFDPDTGNPVKGATQQGHRDDSVWARGQAWGVYGTALSYGFTGDVGYLELFEKITERFISGLPGDLIPYWDFDFQDGSMEPRDASSAAIAACGLLEMAGRVQGPDREKYTALAGRLLKALTDRCLYQDGQKTNGILLHSTYCKGLNPDGTLQSGADECTMWGDYFYMEALIRLTRDWNMYW